MVKTNVNLKKQTINSFQEYLDYIEWVKFVSYEINLYRGQSEDYTLLPSIARKNPANDTTELEITMLKDLKRRSPLLINKSFNNDWEWLVFAQHHGLKTRLLDWTDNPLIALWFACANQTKLTLNSYVYVLSTTDDMLVDLTKNSSPFKNSYTRILSPSLNNERIVAQSGWFTTHPFSNSSKKFVTLASNSRTKKRLTKLEIPAGLKDDFLEKLSIFGVNSGTVYPDFTGLCLHLNWKNRSKI